MVQLCNTTTECPSAFARQLMNLARSIVMYVCKYAHMCHTYEHNLRCGWVALRMQTADLLSYIWQCEVGALDTYGRLSTSDLAVEATVATAVTQRKVLCHIWKMLWCQHVVWWVKCMTCECVCARRIHTWYEMAKLWCSVYSFHIQQHNCWNAFSSYHWFLAGIPHTYSSVLYTESSEPKWTFSPATVQSLLCVNPL